MGKDADAVRFNDEGDLFGLGLGVNLDLPDDDASFSAR